MTPTPTTPPLAASIMELFGGSPGGSRAASMIDGAPAGFFLQAVRPCTAG